MRKLGRMIRRRYLTASVFLGAFLIVTAIDVIRPARAAAALDLAVLVIGGRIFAGLSSLDVASAGHVTAMAVAACAVLLLRVSRSQLWHEPMRELTM